MNLEPASRRRENRDGNFEMKTEPNSDKAVKKGQPLVGVLGA